MEHAIEADGLVKSYPKGVTALDGLSFASRPAACSRCSGPTAPASRPRSRSSRRWPSPMRARRSSAGIDVVANPDAVRRTIGVVAQGSAVDIQATGRENLRLQGQIYGIRGAGRSRQRAQELLERFGLADAADRIARGYSGGMQRRLDIAMALVHDPAGAVPRRADDRPRSRGPRRHVGRDRAAVGRAGQDRAADHALPRGGRPARRADRDRRPRQGRGAGHARRAQARAARRRDPRRPRARVQRRGHAGR